MTTALFNSFRNVPAQLVRVSLLGAVLMVGGLSGCNAVDQAVDCNNICNRFKECFNKDFDASGCADDCRQKADDDEDFARQANTCDACIDGLDCVEGGFTCATDCVGVINN